MRRGEHRGKTKISFLSIEGGKARSLLHQLFIDPGSSLFSLLRADRNKIGHARKLTEMASRFPPGSAVNREYWGLARDTLRSVQEAWKRLGVKFPNIVSGTTPRKPPRT
jgi:hypothetical protein